MGRNDYGPVPVSRIRAESGSIFTVLERDRRVLIAQQGRVVAVIDPPSAIPHVLLAAYATPGPLAYPELTADEIDQGNPQDAVTGALAGGLWYVTKDHKVYGLLRLITDAELAAALPSRGQVLEHERMVSEFHEQHPDATIEDLVAVTEAIAP